MKKLLFKNWLVLMSLVMACGFTACDDDDDNVGTAPIFPEKQEINLAAGGSQEFSFEANTNWSLSSSAIWCVFVKDEVESFVLSGTPGKQTVTVKMTDDAPAHETSVAKLELTMGGEKVVIGEVRRKAQGYDLQLFDEEGNPITELEVGYNDFKRFKVKANYRFAVTNKPSWVKLEGDALVGGINKEVTGGLEIIQDGNMEKYPVTADQKYTLTFASEDGKSEKHIPLVFKGMPEGEIDIEGPSTHPWYWTVSLDGKEFSQSMSGGMGENATKMSLSATITTLNDAYEIVCFNENGVMSQDDSWVKYKEDANNPGKITITVKKWNKERKAYVFALTKVEYDRISNDLEGTLMDMKNFMPKEGYDKYLLLELTQKQTEEESKLGFKVTYTNNSVWPVKPVNIETTLVEDPQILEQYGTDEVYTVPRGEYQSYDIDPKMGQFGSKDSEFGDWYVEGSEDIEGSTSGETMCMIYLPWDQMNWGPIELQENIVLKFFKKSSTASTPEKVLIITPNN